MDFASALKAMKQFDKGLIPYECADEILEDGQTRVSAMDQTRALLSTIERGQTVGILIGPEGGLEKSEVAAAMEAGIHPITLGKRILTGVIIMLLPTIIDVALSTVNDWTNYQGEYETCTECLFHPNNC